MSCTIVSKLHNQGITTQNVMLENDKGDVTVNNRSTNNVKFKLTCVTAISLQL